MLFRFCLYGFLKNQRYFEPFLMLLFLDRGLSFFVIGLLIACRDLTVNLLEIPSGAIADSFGRRGSMLTSFVAYIISFLTLATASSTAAFFVGMILYGVGDTFRTGTHKAMIFEWLRLQNRSDERTRIYGLTRSWSQIGSALSGLIAAAFVLISGSYAYVFYFSIVPYALNLINLGTYPKELDGEHQRARSVAETVSRLTGSLKKTIAQPNLRRLMVESMGWDGVFNATKEYLQPILQALAIAGSAFLFAESVGVPDAVAGLTESDAAGSSWNRAQKTAVLIGPVYAVLFLLSAWASRNAHRLVSEPGSETTASRKLWLANTAIFSVMAGAAWFHWYTLLVVAFIAVYVLKNIWRPILVTRFDSHSDPAEGATILSIESQAQRLSTLVLAPVIGWTIDFVSKGGVNNGATNLSGGSLAGEFWPIGVIGLLISATMLMTSRR
jgi:MFS family permease